MKRAAEIVEGLTNLFVGIVEVFLGVRFIFRLLNANPGNDFVSWLYDVSGRLLEPFRGIFPTETVQPGYVLEFSTLFAMVAYGLLGFLILALVDALVPEETRKKRKHTTRE